MASIRPKVISLTKRSGHTFGFYLRVEHGEDGHLIRCLEMGGPAELAGMKDGDRVVRVNGTFVDGMPHSEVVELVRNSGASVTFHVLDEASYKRAKTQGVNLYFSQGTEVKHVPKPKLCNMIKSGSAFGFSIRSVKGQEGLFMTEVVPGSEAFKAGVRNNDRLLEINGDNIEKLTHEQVVDKIKQIGSNLMFLLADEETEQYYQSKRVKLGGWLATTEYLPHKPRIINMTKGSDGYGFLLKEVPQLTGHFIKDIDRGSPAERAGMKEMDRLVAVDGKLVDDFSHEKVVDMIKRSGTDCCLLVVDKHTDKIYKLGKVSPMLFWEEMKDSNSPPSYTEAVSSSVPVQSSPPVQRRRDELKPKLCKMERTSSGFGFHLNGIQGLYGQYIKEVVKDGAADRAGLENDDFVVEVNGINVEQKSHEDVVEMIRNSGNYLEMLVVEKSIYEQLKAREIPITRHLLEETSYVQVHSTHIVETSLEERHEDEARSESRSESPAGSTRSRSSSSSSDGSIDLRF